MALFKVIAFPTIAILIVVAVFLILKAIEGILIVKSEKSDNNRYSNSWKATTIEREIKERSKEIILEIKQRKLRAITLKGTIEKSSILLS